jgi:DoxX-like protein
MKPKTITILYWVCTILFAGLMLFSAAGGIKPTSDDVKFMHDGLGYPVYFIQFISIAKLIGSIVILIPGLDRIKEWAYAGLFFDLTGAIYSGIALSGKFDPLMLTMLAWIIPGILSYYFWHKTGRSRDRSLSSSNPAIRS